MADEVLNERDGGVLVLTMNRPAKKNALTKPMYDALADGLEEAERDPGVRAVLFQGAGDCFTAGNDVGDFAAVNRSDAPRDRAGVSRFLECLAKGEKPYVAAVHGLAIGVGVTMLLHCDLVFVADDAKLSTPFVNLALVPEAASSHLLQQRIGYARAYAMFALGEPVIGDTAAAWGLANAAVPASEVKARALAAAKALAARPLGSLIATKRLMRDSQAILGQMDREIAEFGKRLKSPEAAEAFAAFAQRRAPDFSKVG
jgi:enoyl-CoA hydratase/carnithine racemase